MLFVRQCCLQRCLLGVAGISVAVEPLVLYWKSKTTVWLPDGFSPSMLLDGTNRTQTRAVRSA